MEQMTGPPLLLIEIRPLRCHAYFYCTTARILLHELAVGMAAIGIIGDDKKIDNGVANEEDVDIKEKERENKGESVVKVDSDVDVGDNGWKDGEMMYLFGGDYGYKKEEDVRDQHINELSAGSLSDDNMDCDIFKKDDMLLFGEEQSIKKDEDVETIVIRSEFRLFGAHNIDRDGYIPSNEQVSVVC